MSAAAIAALPRDAVIGAFEIGASLNVLLMGFVSIQTYFYFSRFSDDPKLLKWFIFGIWVFEVLQTATVLHVQYWQTVTMWGRPAMFLAPPSSLVLSVTWGSVVSSVVPVFLAWRLYKILNILPLTIIAWILTVVRFGGCLALTITGWNLTNLAEYLEKNGWLILAIHIISLVNDIGITIGLCIGLYKSRRKAARKTTAVIDKLIVWSLQSGLLTAMCSTLVVIFYCTLRSTFIWVGLNFLLAKLYSNSLLAILNGRASLRDMSTTETSGATTFNIAPSTIGSQTLDIKVDREQRSDADHEMGHLGRAGKIATF